MADKSKIRYDDFISNVQPDPAKPESTIMLSGFVGHGPEGHARIYPDPTLGTWYDVPEDDVVHSMPIADSKLGGSYVWVRTSAQIKPGSAAPAATEAAGARPAIGMHPTPATHCFVCPPPGPGAEAVLQPAPTPATHCFICPPHQTLPTICTQLPACQQHPTPATLCFICPPHQTLPTICTQLPACQQHPTPATLCFICPPHQTLATICTMPPACPPPQTHQVHCPTQPVVCNIQPTPTVQTHCFICPPHTQNCALGAEAPQARAFEGATVICSQPARCTQACMPQAQHAGGFTAASCVCLMPTLVHPCGHPTLPTVCTLPPACPLPGGGFTVNATQCICLTPGNTHLFCPPHTITAAGCFTAGGCVTMGVCPTVAACTPNGVFTPFGR